MELFVVEGDVLDQNVDAIINPLTYPDDNGHSHLVNYQEGG